MIEYLCLFLQHALCLVIFTKHKPTLISSYVHKQGTVKYPLETSITTSLVSKGSSSIQSISSSHFFSTHPHLHPPILMSIHPSLSPSPHPHVHPPILPHVAAVFSSMPQIKHHKTHIIDLCLN